MHIDQSIGEVCPELSKWGTLEGCEDYLRNLSRTITPEYGVEIYIFFRDHAERHETEWREEFVTFFPQTEPMLPRVDDAEYWQDELFGLVQVGDREGIVAFLQRIGLMNNHFRPRAHLR